MEIGKTRLALSASMLALALALAGCGGGGSGSTTQLERPGGNTSNTGGTDTGNGGMDDDDDDDTMETPTLTMTQQAVVDAKAVVDGLAADAADAVVEMAHRNYLMAAYDEKMAADAAVEMLEDDASADERGTALVRQDDAEKAYAEAWVLKGNESDRADATLRAMAIGPGDPALLNDSMRTSTAFTVKGGELTPATDANSGVEFTKSEDYPDPRSLGDKFSGGYVMVRQFGKYEDGTLNGQWVIPHTDKEADKGATFSEYYGGSPPQAGTLDGDTGFAWKDLPPGVTGDGSAITINGAQAMPATFELFDFDFTMDEDDGAGVKFAGSFHGIPGDLTCTLSCARTFDAMGMLTDLEDGSTWTFTPTEEDAMKLAMLPVADVKEDAEYLDFGVWGTWAYPESGETRKYGAYALTSEGSEALDMLVGQAKYEGMASGSYAMKTENPDGMLEPTSYGGFTATAVLTAEFGERNTVAPIDQETISGSITDFMLTGREANDWTVMLGRAAIDANGSLGRGSTKTTGATGSMTEGEWTGGFLGGDGDATPGVMPSAVTGTFDAHFTNGHVVGAFGAHYQKPPASDE